MTQIPQEDNHQMKIDFTLVNSDKQLSIFQRYLVLKIIHSINF